MKDYKSTHQYLLDPKTKPMGAINTDPNLRRFFYATLDKNNNYKRFESEIFHEDNKEERDAVLTEFHEMLKETLEK